MFPGDVCGGKAMNDLPLVTAVITTYNRPVAILKRAIESVVNQTYSNIEIFIINDCPENLRLTEEIRAMLNEICTEKAITYIIQEKNAGACHARNTALKNAKGEFFACLDDDDEWKAEKIEKQVCRALKDSNVSLVYCNSDIVNTVKKTTRIRFTEEQPEGDIYSLLIGDNIIGSCTFPLMRTDAVKKAGGFNEEFPALQDWDLYLRLLKNGKAGYVHESLAVYYFHEGERISSHPERRVMAYEKLLGNIRQDLKNNKKSSSKFYFKGCYFYELNQQYGKALNYYSKGIQSCPLDIKNNIIELSKFLYRLFIKPKVV